MKYMLLICANEDVQVTPEEASAEAWFEEVTRRGVRPVSDATSVRMRADELLVSDGPFAETKEQICGYDVIECADLDEAIEIASKHPVAKYGTVEVRPFWPM